MPKISLKTSSPVVNLALDTLQKKKQAIVFVGSKAGAEKAAEEIAKHVMGVSMLDLSKKALKGASSSTKQCLRLSKILMKGIAFHHAGLTKDQRNLVEDGFRNSIIKVICSTPSLALGVDLPAHRVVVRDLKRYSGAFGMSDIPVLEYHQMAGRAGRPGKETEGQAICIALTESQEEAIVEKYIKGDPENIYSKLAVEPVLRTYLLSLLAGGFVSSRRTILEFFEKTFWAHQFEDMLKLEQIISKMLGLLESWGFIYKDDFQTADLLQEEKIKITPLGRRVAELYLDPYTANFISDGLKKVSERKVVPFSFLHLLCSTIEMRPPLRVKARDLEDIQEKWIEFEDSLLTSEPKIHDEEFDDFLDAIKTAVCFNDWIEEESEQNLMDKYLIRPGELRAKLERLDWLIYATLEIAKIQQIKSLGLRDLRIRLKNGVKDELLKLLRLKGVGRVRARMLFNKGLKTLKDIKSNDQMELAKIVGVALAKSIKEQLGQEVKDIKLSVKSGQLSLSDY